MTKRRAPRRAIFAGETMTCIVCGAQQRADPHVESQWRALEVDDGLYYACPAEFPPDDADSQDFKMAYTRVLAHIMLRQVPGWPNLPAEDLREIDEIDQLWYLYIDQLRRAS